MGMQALHIECDANLASHFFMGVHFQCNSKAQHETEEWILMTWIPHMMVDKLGEG